MTDDAQVANAEPVSDLDDKEPTSFDLSYVKKLRTEAGNYRTQRNEIREQVAELEKNIKSAEEAKLQESQEWKDLAELRGTEVEELRIYKEQYDVVLEGIRANNTRRVEAVPSTMSGLVPKYDDPVRLAEWLDINAPLLTKQSAPAVNGEAGGKTRPGEVEALTPDELKVAARMQLTAEEYRKGKGN